MNPLSSRDTTSYMIAQWRLTIVTLVESQKGVIAAQRCSVENQKGAIAVQSQWQYRPSGSQRNIFNLQ